MAFALVQKGLSCKNTFGKSASKVIIAAVTGAAHQVITSVTFHCPCVDLSDLETGCSSNIDPKVSPTSQCSQLLNFSYGLIYVAGPAVALFFLGLALQTNFWKLVTGCEQMLARFPRKRRYMCKSMVEIIWRAFLSPLTWICFALFDGRHFACAYTSLPYDVGNPGSMYANCQQVSRSEAPVFSHAYLNTKTFFQLVGCASVPAFSLLYFMVYCFSKCKEPFTYYQAEYAQIYRSTENGVFEKKMKEKALKDAEIHVGKFFNNRRTKEEWDKVMYDDETLGQFGHTYDSPLQKWAVEHTKENSLESSL